MAGWAIFAGICSLLGASNSTTTGMSSIWLVTGVALFAIAAMAPLTPFPSASGGWDICKGDEVDG